MATATATVERRRLSTIDKRWAVPGVLALWLVLWAFLRGTNTLAIGAADLTSVHTRLNQFMNAVDDSRYSNPIFVYFFNAIRDAIDAFATFVQHLISDAPADRPVPQIGWLGVVAIATLLAFAFGNWRVALLTAAGFVFFGLQGLWQESMQTLALTLVSVIICVIIGLPLGVWAGISDRVDRFITPILDFLQTMPSYVYLAPVALFFLIGPASAVIVTFIYAVPPIIRITAHGIRGVSETTVEAATALGSTRRQVLTKVQLPMAKRTTVVGLNQTIMAALSMVTIAALISAPGDGQTVVEALKTLNVGVAFNAGLAIVIMAIILDRTTTAAASRVQRHRADIPWYRQPRRIAVAAGTVVTLFLVYLSHTYLWAADFPTDGVPDIGTGIITGVNSATEWVQANLFAVTDAIRNVVSYGLLNPLQALLADGPWYLTAVAIVALALLLGGRGPAIVAAVCLALIALLGVWYDAMYTLAATLVAAVIVMILGVLVGVWMARSAMADRVIRPVLDAGQVMPAFVYLVPFLGLFGASRLTAIVAAVIYAAPASIKLVADGIRGVPPAAVEAATSYGSTTRQIITKVQLPMARRGLVLAANQGIIYVLAMVVVGGLVGAGALGYDIVAGFTQLSLRGKGLAAGLAVVLLGILLDRTTRAAANRAGRVHR
jgi:glycine betaine/proline transport system permease protein